MIEERAPHLRSIFGKVLLMEEILHQLIGSLSHYLQVFFASLPGGYLGFLPSTVLSFNLGILMCFPLLSRMNASNPHTMLRKLCCYRLAAHKWQRSICARVGAQNKNTHTKKKIVLNHAIVPYTWKIIPLSKWLVTTIYKPFRPFGRGTTLLRGLTNHGY